MNNSIIAYLGRAIYSSFKFTYYYQILRKHSFKDRNGFCINIDDQPTPWYTYPAIDFLHTIDFRNFQVFEFGAGASTVWWSKKAKFVTAVEMNKNWYNIVKQQNLKNVIIELCQDGGTYPNIIQNFDQIFDVISIDGAERFRSAESAISKFSNKGLIILDNSDWYPNTANFFISRGFSRIDFFGFCPINTYPSVTSIFFRPDTHIFQHFDYKKLRVAGGIKISGGALDD